MTSTNDGKDVKSNQTSGQKGKSFYIELYKSLDGRLSSECGLPERTGHLCEAWRRVHSLCLHSAPATHPHLLSWLQRHTARTILQTEWQSPKSKDEQTSLEEAIDQFISDCETNPSKDGVPRAWETQLQQRGEWFKRILGNPWGHPVLRVLLDPNDTKPDDEQILEWLKEERGVMFVTRLRQLAASKCDDLALSLVSAVMERVRAGDAKLPDSDQAEETRDKPPASSESPTFADVLKSEAGFTVDVWELLTDIEFVLLLKCEKRSRCIELAKQTPLRNGYQLVERLQSRLETSPREKKLWKNAKDVATLVAHVIIARCMVVPTCSNVSRTALYCCTRSLVRLLPPARLPAATAALAAPAVTARHLHTLAQAVDAQCKVEMKPFVCELYVRAITAGMNELERLKLKTEKEAEARLAEQTLSSWFTQLGSLLALSERVRCECTLTAFSVHPSRAMYERIKNAPDLPPLAIDPAYAKGESTSEFGSWTTDSRTQSNLVKTSETLNIKQSPNLANVLSTALLTEGEAIGLSPELCQDVAVLLSGPRVKTLSWDMDREALLERCRAYMERTQAGTRALTTELKYLNLDPSSYQHLPEEEDDENDLYYGIEKGYEHLVEVQEPEDVWQDADPERTESACSGTMDPDYNSTGRKKKKNKRIPSPHSSEDSDPLSLVAEIKKEKKKERPLSKDRSKERSKERKKRNKSKENPENKEGSRERRKDTGPEKKKKERKPRKKKLQEPLDPLTSFVEAKPGALSSLIGLKIAKGNKMAGKYKRNTDTKIPPCVTDSDYDSQGKSSLASLNSEGNDPDVLFDGLYNMEDYKSPEKTDPLGTLLHSELSVANGKVAVNTNPAARKHAFYGRQPQHNPNVTNAPTRIVTIPKPDLNTQTKKEVVSEEVKKSITKLIEFRRQKSMMEEAERLMTSSPRPPDIPAPVHKSPSAIVRQEFLVPTDTSPKAVTVPEIPKVYIDKKQIEQLRDLKQDVDALLNPTYTNKPVIQFASTNKPLDYYSDAYKQSLIRNELHNFLYPPNTAPVIPNQGMVNPDVTPKNFQDFLRELQESINAGTGTNKVASNPSLPVKNQMKKEVKPINRVPPVVPHNYKSEPGTSSQCAKSTIQTGKKVDTQLNTFARLSYMHKNKQNDYKLNKQYDPIIDHELLLRKVVEDHKTSKLKYLQAKGDISISRPGQMPENLSKKDEAKVVLKKVENTVTTNASDHPVLSNMLHSMTQNASNSLLRQDDLVKNILQQEMTRSATPIQATQSPVIKQAPRQHKQSKPNILHQEVSRSMTPALSAQCSITKVPRKDNLPKNLVTPRTMTQSHMQGAQSHMQGAQSHIQSSQSHIQGSQLNLQGALPKRDDPAEHISHQEILRIQTPTPTFRETSLSEKDQNDLLLLLRQQNKLNSPVSYLNDDMTKLPNKIQHTTHLNYIPSTAMQTTVIKNYPTELKSNNTQNVEIYKIKKSESVQNIPKSGKSKTSKKNTPKPSTSVPSNNASVCKNQGSVTKSDILQSPEMKKAQDWESVMDALLKHKTPSRGPNALDMALKKNKNLRNQRIVRTNTVFEDSTAEGSLLKQNMQTPGSKPQAAVTKSEQSNTVIHKGVSPVQPASTNINAKVQSSQKTLNEVVKNLIEAELLKRPVHVQKKPYVSELINQKDPFISGIPNSDYDLLEELMDDELRQEIGELSSDEESYRTSAVSNANAIKVIASSKYPNVMQNTVPQQEKSQETAKSPLTTVQDARNTIIQPVKRHQTKSISQNQPKTVIDSTTQQLPTKQPTNAVDRKVTKKPETKKFFSKNAYLQPSTASANRSMAAHHKQNTTKQAHNISPKAKSNQNNVQPSTSAPVQQIQNATRQPYNVSQNQVNVVDPRSVLITAVRPVVPKVVLFGSDLVYNTFPTPTQLQQGATSQSPYVDLNATPNIIYQTNCDAAPIVKEVVIKNDTAVPLDAHVVEKTTESFVQKQDVLDKSNSTDVVSDKLRYFLENFTDETSTDVSPNQEAPVEVPLETVVNTVIDTTMTNNKTCDRKILSEVQDKQLIITEKVAYKMIRTEDIIKKVISMNQKEVNTDVKKQKEASLKENPILTNQEFDLENRKEVKAALESDSNKCNSNHIPEKTDSGNQEQPKTLMEDTSEDNLKNIQRLKKKRFDIIHRNINHRSTESAIPLGYEPLLKHDLKNTEKSVVMPVNEIYNKPISNVDNINMHKTVNDEQVHGQSEDSDIEPGRRILLRSSNDLKVVTTSSNLEDQRNPVGRKTKVRLKIPTQIVNNVDPQKSIVVGGVNDGNNDQKDSPKRISTRILKKRESVQEIKSDNTNTVEPITTDQIKAPKKTGRKKQKLTQTNVETDNQDKNNVDPTDSESTDTFKVVDTQNLKKVIRITRAKKVATNRKSKQSTEAKDMCAPALDTLVSKISDNLDKIIRNVELYETVAVSSVLTSVATGSEVIDVEDALLGSKIEKVIAESNQTPKLQTDKNAIDLEKGTNTGPISKDQECQVSKTPKTREKRKKLQNNVLTETKSIVNNPAKLITSTEKEDNQNLSTSESVVEAAKRVQPKFGKKHVVNLLEPETIIVNDDNNKMNNETVISCAEKRSENLKESPTMPYTGFKSKENAEQIDNIPVTTKPSQRPSLDRRASSNMATQDKPVDKTSNFNENMNTSGHEFDSWKSKIVIEELPIVGNNDRKCVRIKLPNGKTFKATVFGKMHVSFESLFSDPVLKTTLLSNLNDTKRYTVNIKQISTAPRDDPTKIVDTRIEEVNIMTNNNGPIETVNLLSDEEDDLVEPIKPVEPINPVEPIKPVQPINPVEPSNPVELINPVESINPVELIHPVELINLVEPTNPVEHIKPVEPIKPVICKKTFKTEFGDYDVSSVDDEVHKKHQDRFQQSCSVKLTDLKLTFHKEKLLELSARDPCDTTEIVTELVENALEKPEHSISGKSITETLPVIPIACVNAADNNRKETGPTSQNQNFKSAPIISPEVIEIDDSSNDSTDNIDGGEAIDVSTVLTTLIKEKVSVPTEPQYIEKQVEVIDELKNLLLKDLGVDIVSDLENQEKDDVFTDNEVEFVDNTEDLSLIQTNTGLDSGNQSHTQVKECFVKLNNCDDLVLKYVKLKIMNQKCYVDLIRCDSKVIRSGLSSLLNDSGDLFTSETGRSSPVMDAFETIASLQRREWDRKETHTSVMDVYELIASLRKAMKTEPGHADYSEYHCEWYITKRNLHTSSKEESMNTQPALFEAPLLDETCGSSVNPTLTDSKTDETIPSLKTLTAKIFQNHNILDQLRPCALIMKMEGIQNLNNRLKRKNRNGEGMNGARKMLKVMADIKLNDGLNTDAIDMYGKNVCSQELADPPPENAADVEIKKTESDENTPECLDKLHDIVAEQAELAEDNTKHFLQDLIPELKKNTNNIPSPGEQSELKFTDTHTICDTDSVKLDAQRFEIDTTNDLGINSNETIPDNVDTKCSQEDLKVATEVNCDTISENEELEVVASQIIDVCDEENRVKESRTTNIEKPVAITNTDVEDNSCLEANDLINSENNEPNDIQNVEETSSEGVQGPEEVDCCKPVPLDINDDNCINEIDLKPDRDYKFISPEQNDCDKEAKNSEEISGIMDSENDGCKYQKKTESDSNDFGRGLEADVNCEFNQDSSIAQPQQDQDEDRELNSSDSILQNIEQTMDSRNVSCNDDLEDTKAFQIKAEEQIDIVLKHDELIIDRSGYSLNSNVDGRDVPINTTDQTSYENDNLLKNTEDAIDVISSPCKESDSECIAECLLDHDESTDQASDVSDSILLNNDHTIDAIEYSGQHSEKSYKESNLDYTTVNQQDQHKIADQTNNTIDPTLTIDEHKNDQSIIPCNNSLADCNLDLNETTDEASDVSDSILLNNENTLNLSDHTVGRIAELCEDTASDCKAHCQLDSPETTDKTNNMIDNTLENITHNIDQGTNTHRNNNNQVDDHDNCQSYLDEATDEASNTCDNLQNNKHTVDSDESTVEHNDTSSKDHLDSKADFQQGEHETIDPTNNMNDNILENDAHNIDGSDTACKNKIDLALCASDIRDSNLPNSEHILDPNEHTSQLSDNLCKDSDCAANFQQNHLETADEPDSINDNILKNIEHDNDQNDTPCNNSSADCQQNQEKITDEVSNTILQNPELPVTSSDGLCKDSSTDWQGSQHQTAEEIDITQNCIVLNFAQEINSNETISEEIIESNNNSSVCENQDSTESNVDFTSETILSVVTDSGSDEKEIVQSLDGSMDQIEPENDDSNSSDSLLATANDSNVRIPYSSLVTVSENETRTYGICDKENETEDNAVDSDCKFMVTAKIESVSNEHDENIDIIEKEIVLQNDEDATYDTHIHSDVDEVGILECPLETSDVNDTRENKTDCVYQENDELLDHRYALQEKCSKQDIPSELNDVSVTSKSTDNSPLKMVEKQLKINDEIILNGIEYEDPEVGTCYVFPIVEPNTSSCEDTFDEDTEEIIQVIQELNEDGTVDNIILETTEMKSEEPYFKVKTPQNTYSRLNQNQGLKYLRKPLKRKIDMSDIRISVKKYRKGKNIDYPKITAAAMIESAYSKEFKRIFDYSSSLKFSYSQPFHKDVIDVEDILKNWPLSGSHNSSYDDQIDNDDILFADLDNIERYNLVDPLQQSLAEEITEEFTELDFSPMSINETNFNMGFGERSDRVIQNLEDVGDDSKFSAATLSDVKQPQPFLLSEDYEDETKHEEVRTREDQMKQLKRYFSYIQMRDKVRTFFKKTTVELKYNWVKEKFSNKCEFTSFPFDLCNTMDFMDPPITDVHVQVVQVGQLPVSAAAQNPVTCDPRVTQVSNASPPQCSAENSLQDDSQPTIKTEYTELTTADLSGPMMQEYVQHIQNLPMEPQDSTNMQMSDENIPIETEIKSVVKIELMEESEEREEMGDTYDYNALENQEPKHEINVEYSFDTTPSNTTPANTTPDNTTPANTTPDHTTPANTTPDNTTLENITPANTTSESEAEYHNMYNSPQNQDADESVPAEPIESRQATTNGVPEKTDQIAHAMNAAGITTTSETMANSTSSNALVNILSHKLRQGSVGTTQPTNSYPKTTAINAMALQQALAQILPPPLNQTNGNENAQQANPAPQVLHIVQGKNASGSQITLVDNSQQSVINGPNATPVLHIVQNKSSAGATSNGSATPQTNSFSGLSLVDTGLQQGGNQLLQIVNTGNQKNNNATGQLLKRVNLLTNLTNVQGSNEQKMVQFVCKSADGKSIQLNAPHQRSMVLRLQPIETPNVQTNPKPAEGQDLSPTSSAALAAKEAANQQEIKSRSMYEENYAKFIQNSSPKTTAGEKATSLPKFNQAFGKPVFQDGNQNQNEMAANNSHVAANNKSDSSECQAADNAMNLDHIGRISSPPLLVRKPAPQTSQPQVNLVQQLKQTITPMNIQTMHGGVIYTRQIPVNIGGGQTINLITVPSTELVDDNQKQQQGAQSEIEPSIIKIVPQNQTAPNTEISSEDGANMNASNEGNQNPQPVLTQMRIKLPMLSKAPQMVSGARVVRPSYFQIQRNVIGGANQPVYQQLVLTAAPPLGQQTIRLPQAQATRQIKVQDSPSSAESQMSSSTLEQLREFDMVLEQVKERSSVPPSSSSSSFSKMHTTSIDTTDGSSASSTSTETSQQVLYSIGNSHQPLNVAYVNRKLSTVTTPTTSSFVRSPDSSGIVDSPTSSTHVQIHHTVTTESAHSEAPAQPKPKSKSKSRPKTSVPHPPNNLKLNPVPPKTSAQKPFEDEQTTQRILYILAEYKEQVENSPDKDKPAPRRRTHLTSHSSGSSKRKKSSSSRRHGNRDMSPIHGEDTCRTMGSEDSSCGTSQGDCNESCLESHSPQDSPRKVVRKLNFEHDTPVQQPRPQPQRNVIVADGQTITVARGTAGKPATAVLMPANYILPVSMVKGGQQIAIVTNRGPKLLTVGGGEGGATNALLLQRLIGPAGLKPVLTRPGVRHVRLPTAALHNLQAFNFAAATTVHPPDSTASPAPAPTPPELIDTRATSSPWTDRDCQDVKPERGSSPEGSEPWHLPTSGDPHDYIYEETVRADNLNRTVLDPIPDRYSPDMEAQRIFDKMFDVESKKSYMGDSQDDPRCAYDIDASDYDDKAYHQVVQKKDGSTHRQHRLTHVSAAALRHKYAILEHELRLQKSLSEECEDLGVDSPSASELFPEAELLFANSPAHEHAQDQGHHSHTPQPTILNQSCIPQPDMDDQIATDQLLSREMHDDQQDLQMGLEDVGIVTVSEDGTQATIALDHEEFARSHPNTTFHSEPEVGEVQPFTIAGLRGRQITSTIFHSSRAPATVLMSAPHHTVIAQPPAHQPHPQTIKYSDIDNMINSIPSNGNNINLSSVLVKDDGLTRFDTILNDSRELHLSNTASAIVHSAGNATQVIRRVCYEEDKRERDNRFLMDEPEGLIAGDDAKMVAEDSRDATLQSMANDVDDYRSSPERHAELFWESNSTSERSENRRPMDFSSDSDKCCKSPSYDETNSTDSSGVGAHMRLDSVIKDARGIERSVSAENSSDDTHPPLRTYPPKRTYHPAEGEAERSVSGKTRAGEGEVRRRASGRGVVKRGCHCCSHSPAPQRPKKPRQRKPTMDFTTN